MTTARRAAGILGAFQLRIAAFNPQETMPKKQLFVVALASLLTLGAASPALADCCDSVWDCAATVATEGLSCALQEFIDTVKGLITFVTNLTGEATGATGDATRSAQQFVSQTIDVMTSQSQSSDAELRQADESAKKLASEEKQFKVIAGKTVAQVPTTGVTPASPQPATRPAGATPEANAHPANGSTSTRATVRNPNVAITHPTAPSSTPLTGTTVAQSSATEKTVGAPARSYMAEMDRASAEISKSRAQGDQDLATISQYMEKARQTEGSGIKSANAIADQAIEAPFKNLMSQLTSMLTNPTELSSPTSAVEAAANSIMSNLDVSIDQVIEAITSGPNQAFQAAQPSYGNLQSRAANAQQIASAMALLYRDRSPGALAALEALLPKVATSAAGSSMHSTTGIAGHVAFSQVMTNYATSKQKTKASFLQRVRPFSQRMAQYEAVRAKARSNRSSIATYRANFSTKLNAYLTGKTPAELAVQRDSLIVEARKHFANDPKTRDAVINLLSSETSRRVAVIKR